MNEMSKQWILSDKEDCMRKDVHHKEDRVDNNGPFKS